MIGAALLAKKAVEKGLNRKPWVKTTLAPGSKVVMDYYERAGLIPYLDKLGFNLVGYGCTTCIGNSGPLPAGDQRRGQRQRPHRGQRAVRQPQLRGPDQPGRQDELPGVPAARRRLRPGRHDGHRPGHRAARHRQRGQAGLPRRHLAVARRGDQRRRERRPRRDVHRRLRRRVQGRRQLARPAGPEGDTFEWAADSTYVRRPPYFDGMPAEPAPVKDISGAKVLAKLGDSVTTDHISPAGAIKATAPGGPVPDRARHRARRLQLLRQPPRQPRGDDPRHVRQHPAAQPARAGHRGRRHRQGRQGDVDLRRLPRVHRGGHPADRARRQGVRLGLLPRLGGEGHRAARRARRARRVVRAHPPLQPDRHGRAAAPVQAGRERRVPRPHRRGDLHRSRASPRSTTAASRTRSGDCRRQAASPPRCGSTPPARPTTTATAASCSTSCAACSPPSRRTPSRQSAPAAAQFRSGQPS